MAQRQRRDWRDALLILASLLEKVLLAEWRSCCPLEPVLLVLDLQRH